MRGRLVFGILLVILGVWWVLDLTGVEVLPGGLGTWWPSLLILWALSRYVVHPYWRMAPLFIAALGGLLLADRLGYLPQGALVYSIPVLLVLMGVRLVVSVRRQQRERPGEPFRMQMGGRIGNMRPMHAPPPPPADEAIDVTPRGPS